MELGILGKNFVLHLSFLNRGEDDSHRVQEQLEEPITHSDLIIRLVLPHTADVEAQRDLWDN